MMKHWITYSVVALFISPTTAYSQGEWHVPSSETLAVSLNGLKKSADQMSSRNQWLQSEIEVLKLKIADAKENDFKKSTYKSLSVHTDPIRAKSRKTLGIASSNSLNSEQLMNSKSLKKQSIHRQIAIVQDEIRHFSRMIESGDGDSIDFSQDGISQIEGKLQAAQLNVKALEKTLKRIEKENSRHLSYYEGLKKKNDLLKQKYALLNEDYKNNVALEKEMLTSIKRLESQNSTFLNEMQERITHLRGEGKSLERVLNKANNKIKRKNTDLNISDDEIELLMENLSVIERENQNLKQKYGRLENDLKTLKYPSK